MAYKSHHKISIITFVFALFILIPSVFHVKIVGAAEPAGRFTFVEGRVDLLAGGALPASAVKVGDPVYVKDIIRTKSDSKAEITFEDNSMLRIAQRSRIDISEYITEAGKRSTVIRLPRGNVQAIVPQETVKPISISPEANRFEIHTPNAVAGVRGTEFFVFQENNFTGVFVTEGIACVQNPRFLTDMVCVPAGFMTLVDELRRPQPPRRATNTEMRRLERGVRMVEAVQLTLPESTAPQSITDFATSLTETPSKLYDVPNVIPFTENTPKVLIPAIEVGRTNLSGSLLIGPTGNYNYMSVFMNNVIFLAPSTGERPSLWSTGAVTGQYNFGPYLNEANLINYALHLTNGLGLNADFKFTQWNTSTSEWLASILNGSGNLNSGSFKGSINFSGEASGKFGQGLLNGKGSGTVN